MAERIGLGHSYRRIWRLRGAGGEVRIIRRLDARRDDEFLVNPPGIGVSLDRWIADPFALRTVREIFAALTGHRVTTPVRVGRPDRALKPRLERAFRTGELLVLRVRPRLASRLAQAPGDAQTEKVKDTASQEAKQPASKPASEKKTWIEFEVVGPDGKPAAGVRYRLKITDGSVRTGVLDASGQVRVSNIDPGDCEFALTDLDAESWRPA